MGQSLGSQALAEEPAPAKPTAAASSSSPAAASSNPAPAPAPALEVIDAERKWWQVGPFKPKPPTNSSTARPAAANRTCMPRQQQRSIPRARPTNRNFSEPTPEQISQLASFTGADPDVCTRILKDCRGDEQAAAQWLLLSGGRETMCITVPEGQAAGSTMQVATPRGLVAVEVPRGLQPGAEFTFTLPPPPATPSVARFVDGAPAPQATATMAQGAPANGSSYPGSNVYNATPPVVILDAGRPYAPYVRPCYGCEPTALEHCLAYARTLNPARFPLPPPRPPLRVPDRYRWCRWCRCRYARPLNSAPLPAQTATATMTLGTTTRTTPIGTVHVRHWGSNPD